MFADRSIAIKPGCGWLPNDWLDERGVQEAMRMVSRVSALRVAGYGHPWGYAPLGEYVAQSLALRGLPVERAQVLLTSGATQALDLIVRTLFKAGDVVAVEDPVYCNVLQVLKLAGLRVVGVPRTPKGSTRPRWKPCCARTRPAARAPSSSAPCCRTRPARR